jgi:nucleoside-diphosphate-sugar epimerase
LSSTENDPKQRRPVILKAQILLGFEPKIELVAGIQKTLGYFQNIQYIQNIQKIQN